MMKTCLTREAEYQVSFSSFAFGRVPRLYYQINPSWIQVKPLIRTKRGCCAPVLAWTDSVHFRFVSPVDTLRPTRGDSGRLSGPVSRSFWRLLQGITTVIRPAGFRNRRRERLLRPNNHSHASFREITRPDHRVHGVLDMFRAKGNSQVRHSLPWRAKLLQHPGNLSFALAFTRPPRRGRGGAHRERVMQCRPRSRTGLRQRGELKRGIPGVIGRDARSTVSRRVVRLPGIVSHALPASWVSKSPQDIARSCRLYRVCIEMGRAQGAARRNMDGNTSFAGLAPPRRSAERRCR
mgnify:CR=1 FL=1|jgi:hypothetical protein